MGVRGSFAQRAAGIDQTDSIVVSLEAEVNTLGAAIARMAAAIQQRIARSDEAEARHHPVRVGPDLPEAVETLTAQWHNQGGVCGLCKRPIPLAPRNRLLQMSPDRIDSAQKSYAADNLHITHLGCNLAKSSATLEEWNDYLMIIRARL